MPRPHCVCKDWYYATENKGAPQHYGRIANSYLQSLADANPQERLAAVRIKGDQLCSIPSI